MTESDSLEESKLPEPLPYAAPMLSLETQFPIHLSWENHYHLFNDPVALQIQQDRNEAILAERTFPWLTLLICVGLTISFFIYRFFFKPVKKYEPPPSPREEANQKIKDLSTQLSQLKSEAFYSNLLFILTPFLETSLNLNLKTSTSEEISHLLKHQSELPLSQVESISNLYKKADPIKFAKSPSTEEDRRKDLDFVNQLINR